MGRRSFRQELKALAKASEGMDAGGCWGEVGQSARERVIRWLLTLTSPVGGPLRTTATG